MQRPKLQLALDMLDLQLALDVVSQTQSQVDVIEAGTFLCLSEGMKAIRSLKSLAPEKIIVGDVRIARAGRNIADMAFDAGANWVTVVGEAPLETVEAAVRVAETYKGEIQLELNDDWTAEQAKAWRELGIEHVIYHSTSEVESVGSGWSQDGFDTLNKLVDLGFKVTATGGIHQDVIPSFADIPVFVFIAGRAIVKTTEPLAAARSFQVAIAKTYV